jgi:hypothetical protein
MRRCKPRKPDSIKFSPVFFGRRIPDETPQFPAELFDVETHSDGGKDPAPRGAAVNGKPLPIASKLRLDHGALAALRVPRPNSSIIAAIRIILERTIPLKSGRAGFYEQCEELAGAEADQILIQLRNTSNVKVAPDSDTAKVNRCDTPRPGKGRLRYRAEPLCE